MNLFKRLKNNKKTSKQEVKESIKIVEKQEFGPFSIFSDFTKEKDVEKKIYTKYGSLVPEGLTILWKTYGFGTFLNGYMKMINPDDYIELVKETYSEGKDAVPIFVTAFGDVLTFGKDGFMSIIRYKTGDADIIALVDDLAGFGFFCRDFNVPSFVERNRLEQDLYEKAVKRLGKPKFDECFGYVPLLGLGGSPKIENLKIVKTREHIELISVLVGKVYY